ncbi:MAG: CotH kinase family protein [Saprospiraceae bacterium]
MQVLNGVLYVFFQKNFSQMKYFKLVVVLFFFNLSMSAQVGDQVFDDSYIHEIRLSFSEPEYWDTLTTWYDDFNTFSGEDIPYLKASMTFDGTQLDTIGVRIKGKSSVFYVPNDKLPFKLDFNEFIEEQSFDGLKKINLHNGFGDPGMMRDFLSYGLMREVGVSAPRVAYSHVYLNDEYWGLYEIIEQVDKTFLENNFASGKGNLWKNQRWSELKWYGDDPNMYRDTFELKTNKTEDDWSAFIHFLDVLNNTPDQNFADSIESVFNVDQYLHALAVDIMVNNWDSYLDNERNFYLYHEPKSGKFHWIPWDYNLSMGGAVTTSGDPYPPYDPSCILQTDFTFTKNNPSVNFDEYSEPAAETWYWDFGDGTVSTTQNPIHVFDNSIEKVEVCLTTTRLENGNTCEQTRCKEIDLSENPADCQSIIDGSCPYPATDPIFQQTIEEDPFCCSNDWDVFCEIKYQEIENNPPVGFNDDVDYDINFPILLDNPDKILIDRILNVPEYRDRYLDICCVMLEKVFNVNEISTRIDEKTNMIRDAVHEDPNYMYTHDFFEYDTGNGTGGGNTKIPSLRYFMNQRFGQLVSHLAATQHNCAPAFTNLEFHDLVVNEFIAMNQEGGGIPDAAGEFDDWIEIYNNTFQTINLSGYYLSDDSTNPKKWIFPKGSSIAPGEYLMVWADKDLNQNGLHTDFKLSKTGESLVLSHEDETIIDLVNFGEQTANIAMARIPNGMGEFVFQEPTFQQNNEESNAIKNVSVQAQFSIFPNPTDDFIRIKFQNNYELKDWKVTLTNAIGEKIQEQIFSNNNTSTKLDVQHLPSGIYFLEIQNGATLQSKKIFIF